MMSKAIDFLFRQAKWILAVQVCVTVFFFLQFPKVKIAASYEGWFNKHDPLVQDIYEFQKTFPGSEMVAVGMKKPDLFSADTLSAIADLTGRLEKVVHVESVWSLTNYKVIKRGGFAGLTPESLIPSLPKTAEESEALKERALNQTFLRNLLISDDGQATAFIIFTKTRQSGKTFRKDMMDGVYAAIEASPLERDSMYISGGPPLDVELSRLILQETFKYVPIVMVMIACLLLFAFRTARGVLLPLASILVSFVWTMGLYIMTGHAIGMTTTLLPPLVLILGVANAIHIMVQHHEELGRNPDPDAALRKTVRNIALPCMMTSLTTAVGFISLLLNESPLIQEFGQFAAIGILFSFINAITLIPIGLINAKSSIRPAKHSRGNRAAKALLAVHNFNDKGRWLVMAASVATIIFSSVGLSRIIVEANEIEFLKDGNFVKEGFRFMERNLAGLNLMEMTLQGKDGKPLTDLETLGRIDEFEGAILKSDNVKQVLSLLSGLKMVNMGMENGDPAAYRLPTEQARVDQALKLSNLFASTSVKQYSRDSFSVLRVTARLPFLGSRGFKKEMERIKAEGERIFGGDVEVRFRGLMPLYVHLTSYIIQSQVRSLGAVIAVIFVMFIFFQRSVYMAVIAMIPNLIPILLTFGIMGWFRIRLDVATAMIGSVAIGIAVDDTIHYLARHRREYARLGDHEAAAKETIATTGRAIVFTSVILFLGFVILCTSSFKPIYYFGLLTSLTMASALIGDLFLLPTLIMALKPAMKKPEE